MTTLLQVSLGLLCSLGTGIPRVGAPPLEVGAEAPQFEAKDVDGQSVDLQKLVARGPVVLVFFPKAGTPLCTQELQTFVARAADIKKYGATVVAISTDKEEVLQGFRDDLKANFPFISDGKAIIAGRYQARMPIVYQARRRTYVIDHSQHIAFMEEDDNAMKLTGVVEALAALQH